MYLAPQLSTARVRRKPCYACLKDLKHAPRSRPSICGSKLLLDKKGLIVMTVEARRERAAAPPKGGGAAEIE